MREIQSNLKNINTIFIENNYLLHIPVFQREFVWDENIVKQLVDDFSEDSSNFSADSSSLPGYLLGNIVLIEPNNENKYYSVVDGQQRLISLTLLAKALHNRLLTKVSQASSNLSEMQNWMDLISGLNKVYSIIDDDNRFISPKISFNEYLKYGDFYTDLLKNDSVETELETSSKSEENIYEVFLKFHEIVLDLSDNQLKKITNYFKKNIKIIVTESPSEEKAFQLFEVLNSRGRALEPLDLIKNVFLQKIFENGHSISEKNRFSNDWKEFSNNLEINKNRVISSSTFLKHYIIARYGVNVKKNNLYTFIKELSMDGVNAIEISKDLKRISEIYRDLELKDYGTFLDATNDRLNTNQEEELTSKLHIIFKILGVTQFHSLLIPFYFENFEIKSRVLDNAIKYGASVLFAQRQTNVIENEIESFLYTYINSEDANKIEELLKAIETKKRNYIQEFEHNLYMVNYGNRKQKALTILKFIESYGNYNTGVLAAPKTGINSITLEHITPQTPLGRIEENNFNDRNLYKLYVNYIGNLTLLKKSDNSGVNNSNFFEKSETYKASNYYMTSNLINKTANNRSSGQEYDRINNINYWNPTFTDLEDENNEPIIIDGHWTKEAIISRGKIITNYLVELLS